MTDSTDSKEQDRKTLSLGTRGKLTLGKVGEAAQVRQSFSHGRSKTVTVEVKRKRHLEHGGASVPDAAAARAAAEGVPTRGGSFKGHGRHAMPRALTAAERETRERALRTALREEEARRVAEPEIAPEPVVVVEEVVIEEAAPAPEPTLAPAEPQVAAPPPPPPPPVVEILDPAALRHRELAELKSIEDEEQRRAAEERQRLADAERQREDEAKRREAERTKEKTEDEERRKIADRSAKAAVAKVGATPGLVEEAVDELANRSRRPAGAKETKRAPTRTRGEPRRRAGKMTITQALDDSETVRVRSLAAMRRARERERRAERAMETPEKFARDVVIPETISVQELALRMAERGADVIKALMRMGVMATITQTIDADTAELIVTEFGHRPRRVSEADVELGLKGAEDQPDALLERPPVVTVMGHVDHGKTSLLDAMRQSDVASHEAGGITQHIGAYQVELPNGARITFIDTPGHAAFTAMRARGANVTDVVVLVVAADDGVMPQTIEAIRHARAAEVPIIVAINKCDLPGANPDRVRQELLQHSVVVEGMGGDVLDVEVSAKTKQGLDRLVEAIQLQAEVLELRANPDRPAQGAVIEAKLERGRGAVATVLVQAGTLRLGDIVVAGSEWGRVRALLDERGNLVKEALPARPVEVLGLNGAPLAGDEFAVVENEQRAREITEFRSRKKREAALVAVSRGTVQEMFSRIQAGEVKELPVVIKGDVQGSVEAIAASLERLSEGSTEVKVRVLHAAVGGINESDITLAAASRATIIGFNVRANPLAREMAKRDGVEIRYYGVIYNVIDDIRAALSGLLSPTLRENFLGNAEIREVFTITKVGKVAGCYVTEGIVKRGARVRLLRDHVVIHEGTLKTLRRFKDDVREVREGFECGMAFENYEDIRAGDVIEAFEIEEVARSVA